MTMVNRLFVYGSLKPGGPNHHIIDDIGGDWAAATINGRLLKSGWGAELGYPALEIDPQADPVEGFVFTSDRIAEHWNDLDAFEGQDYQRVIARADLVNNESVETFVYVLRSKSN